MTIDELIGTLEFYRETKRKARKVYECNTCKRKIAKGETHFESAGKFEAQLFHLRFCSPCFKSNLKFLSIKHLRSQI